MAGNSGEEPEASYSGRKVNRPETNPRVIKEGGRDSRGQ